MLFKVGTTIINLERATAINTRFCSSDDRMGVRVYFGAESETFYGHDAIILFSYLESVAVDLDAIHADKIARDAYMAAATARTCPTCGGEGDCPDCDPRP
jgi:hypothetical protein